MAAILGMNLYGSVIASQGQLPIPFFQDTKLDDLGVETTLTLEREFRSLIDFDHGRVDAGGDDILLVLGELYLLA